MLFDFKHEFVDYPIHILDDSLPTNIGLNLMGILLVEGPVGVDFGNVFELMVEVVVVQLQGTDSLDFLLATLINA